MLAYLRLARKSSTHNPATPRLRPASRSYNHMASTSRPIPLEEQTLSRYKQKRYYPVRIGDVFKDRYRIIAKQGFGAYSTVWLAHDTQSSQYVTLKVCVADSIPTSPPQNEVTMLRHMKEAADREPHDGHAFVRFAVDIFEVESESAKHQCIVAKAQGASLYTLQHVFADGKMPSTLVRSHIHRLIIALNFLHADCNVVHSDVTAQNVLEAAEDDAHCELIVRKEREAPSEPFIEGEQIIYESRAIESLQGTGVSILTDFGSMRLGEPPSTDWAMPDTYRAPEVLLKLPWSYLVDVWCLGIMALELLEGKNVFTPIDTENNQYVLPLALAQYIGYLGLPPLHMLKKSPLSAQYFDEAGNWTSEPPIPETSLEDFITTVPPGHEKDLLLKFLRKVLTWDPEKRANTFDLVHDEWLMLPYEL